MVRKILPDKGDMNGIMSPMIPFNMIVDTDIGLFAIILKYYLDPKVFNESFFKDRKIVDLIHILYNREKENPLYLCINQGYEDSCDSLYEELIVDKYAEILQLSVKTEFYKLIRSFNLQRDISLTIVCNRQEEIDLLKAEEVTRDNNIVLYDDLSVNDIIKFNQFYFKYIQDANGYVKYLIDKSIYFANYKFNRNTIDEFIDPTLVILAQNNVLNIIDIFNTKVFNKEEE